jgi:putative N6-adenine-specific DNA methylase
LATFDAEAWARMRAVVRAGATGVVVCHGRDRDAGAVAMSIANAERAGVAGLTEFRQGVISELTPPEGPPGLVMVNPPFGARLGDSAGLAPLYRAMGQVLRERFSGWRVGLVAQEAKLAQATGLPFLTPGAPVPHGGLRVTLWRTGVLG